MKPASEIQEIIVSFIADDVGSVSREELSLDENLFTSGHLDSISIMRLIAHLESELGFKIPPRDLVPKNFLTVNAMVAYLKPAQAAAQS